MNFIQRIDKMECMTWKQSKKESIQRSCIYRNFKSLWEKVLKSFFWNCLIKNNKIKNHKNLLPLQEKLILTKKLWLI